MLQNSRSKRSSARISSSPSLNSSTASASTPDGAHATDTELENARRRQRRMREVESDNLDGSQTADTPPPPDGGGGLSGSARSGSNSSRQGRQPPASTRNPQTPPSEQIINHVTGWRNVITYDFTQRTVRDLLASRAQGEAIGLNERHPLRTCFTAETAQFFCNILFTMAEDVQALWEASG